MAPLGQRQGRVEGLWGYPPRKFGGGAPTSREEPPPRSLLTKSGSDPTAYQKEPTPLP